MKSGFKLIVAVTVLILTVALVFSEFREYMDLMVEQKIPAKKKLFAESNHFHQQAKKTNAEKPTLQQRLPQIIGIGSKKCGTGAFRQFLSFHSQIKCTKIDETHYFDEKYSKGVDFYKEFMPWTKANEITFEKTPKYIVTKEVPQRIIQTYTKEGIPTPKFVWVVCDPVHRAFSDFTQAKRNTDDPNKSILVGNYENFDEYLTAALAKINAFAPLSGNVYDFYEQIEWLYEDRELRFLLRGVYSYYFQQWLKFFPLEDFVIVKGDDLVVNPGKVMVEAQQKLGLNVEIKSKHFAYVPEKGLYCVKIDSNRNSCLGEGKGNTRNLVNGTVVQSGLSDDAKRKLEEFYRPFMKHFRQLI